MLPIVARSAEVVLNLVPDSLREAALALGTPRWRVVVRVVLPTALSGLVTGCLLAIARGAGETAPLLFTASLVNATNFDLGKRHELAVRCRSSPMSSRPRTGSAAGMGGGAHARRPRPHAHPGRAPRCAKETV